MPLSGRVALVTGGARRLGREMTLALARAGADVMVAHGHSAGDAAEVAADVRRIGRRCEVVEADLSRLAGVHSVIDAVRREYGTLHVLVNNASRFDAAPVQDVREEDWDIAMAVNLKAPFFLSRAAAPMLAETRGVIVNIADLSAFQPWVLHPVHAISKAGLVHMTRVLARALAPRVRVNCIAPGTVLPPAEYKESELRRDAERAPLGRIGTPEDVCRALLYLVESEFVTGETMRVDGGRTLA